MMKLLREASCNDTFNIVNRGTGCGCNCINGHGCNCTNGMGCGCGCVPNRWCENMEIMGVN